MEAFAAGDLDAVDTAAEALRGDEEFQAHVGLLEGMILLRTGRLLEAIEHFGEAKDHPDTQASAYALSGEALYRARMLRDAPRILERAIELDPSAIDARRWLAAAYYDTGAMLNALKVLETIAEQEPDDPRPNRLRGLIHKDLEAYTRAARDYRESLRRAPNQPDKDAIRAELAECLIKRRKHAEALGVLADCPETAQTLTLRAECHHAQQDYETAAKLVNKALQLAPDHLGALMQSALLDIDAGNAEKAAETLRRAIEHHPKDYKLRFQLIRAYRALGRQDLAAEQAKPMQELRELRSRFADLHTQAMNDIDNADIRYELGVAAEQFEKPVIARDWFKAALALDPEHALARQALQAGVKGDAPP